MQTAVSAAPEQVLSCRDVSVRAGGREVVAPFSWQHRRGGVAWLFGSNGSGKSSLLRVLAGWQRAASGNVQWSGTSADQVLYHAPLMAAPAGLRVCEFVDLAASVRNGSEDAELQTLWPTLTDDTIRFRDLSTGEAKRILLWSILRQDPTALILDEPYEHLSRDVKPVLTRILQRWARHAIVIIATNQDVPIQTDDTVLTLNGTTLEVGSAF